MFEVLTRFLTNCFLYSRFGWYQALYVVALVTSVFNSTKEREDSLFITFKPSREAVAISSPEPSILPDRMQVVEHKLKFCLKSLGFIRLYLLSRFIRILALVILIITEKRTVSFYCFIKTDGRLCNTLRN